MKIIVASRSLIKLDAVRRVFSNAKDVEIVGVEVPSGVPEQPVGDETILGAWNRLRSACQAEPDADIYIAMENGIFFENGKCFDKGLILVVLKDIPATAYTEPCEFPTQYVEEARRRGFDTVTVGKVMAEAGFVQDHRDPHLNILGKSRLELLARALSDLLLVG